MRIEAIHIQNFLSFQSFYWRDLDPHLNVIVGSNGSGKTNLFHAIRAVVDAVGADGQAAATWARATHRGSQYQWIKIILDVVFDSEWEQRLLTTFFVASLLNEQHVQEVTSSIGRPPDYNALSRYASQLVRDVKRSDLEWFYTGRFTAHFDGIRWQTSYEARNDASTSFFMGLDYAQRSSMFLGQKQDTPPIYGSFFRIWLDSLDPSDAANGSESNEQQRATPRKDAILASLTGNDEVREVAPYTFCKLPDIISAQQGALFQVERPANVALDTYRVFELASGIRLKPNERCDARRVFQILLEHSCIFTDNVRRLPRQAFQAEELEDRVIDLSTGENLALALFQLKNAPTDELRTRYRAIQCLFKNLVDRTFEVSLIPSVAESLDRSNDRRIHLAITTDADWGEMPLEYSGAGITEALFISTIIEGSRGRLVLLDEPASNLYPLAQTALLHELQARVGNQFLVVTHAPALIPAEAHETVSRLFASNARTMRAALEFQTMERTQPDSIRKELRRSLDLRALLFNRAVILLEGETELGALPVWFEKEFGYPLARNDIACYWVGGDTQFPIPMLWLHQLMVPSAVICDGRVIGDQRPSRIIKAMRSAGIPDLPVLNDVDDFMQLRYALEPTGIFTTATAAVGEGESFEGLQIVRDHLDEATEVVGGSKAQRGRYIAETYSCPEEVKTVFHLMRRYFETKGIRM